MEVKNLLLNILALFDINTYDYSEMGVKAYVFNKRMA
jgi:hypothetical protein